MSEGEVEADNEEGVADLENGRRQNVMFASSQLKKSMIPFAVYRESK